MEVPVPNGASFVGKSLLELELPKDVLVVLIQREGKVLVPRGGTQINELDTLLVLSDRKSLRETLSLFEVKAVQV